MTPTHAPAPARTPRSLGDILRGLAATAALVGFVIGVPIALFVVAPIPDTWPSWDGILAALTRPDDGTLLLAAIQLIAWAAWATFTISVLTEVAAAARRVSVPHLPLLGGMQRLAATLVTTAGLLLASSAPLISTAAGPSPVVVTEPMRPAANSHLETTSTTVAEVAASRDPVVPSGAAGIHVPTVVVQRGDTLWDLAERHLGDGHRYAEILDLNLGRPQADGRALDDAHWIYPGWQLRLPDDATALDQPSLAPATNGTTDTYTVERGDTLWDIAAEHLGDPARYAEIAALNRGVPQPHGGALTDSDVIEPGWLLEMPGSSAATALDGPRESIGEPESAGEAPARVPIDDGRLPTDDATAPADGGGPLLDDETTGVGDRTAPFDDVHPTADDADTLDGDALDDAEAPSSTHAFYLGLTALAATGAIGELARRRRLQQRVRRTGERIALPAEQSPAHDAERTLRDAAPPLTIPVLKQALLNLASRCYAAERDLPRLAAITLTPSAVALHLTEDDPDPVEPFVATDARTWTAPHTAVSDDADIDDPERPEPYPALVTLGHTTDGTVLLNLEAAGTLTLTGDPETAADVLRALVAELATSDLTGRIGLVAGPEFTPLADACDTARLQIATPASLAAQVAQRAAEVARALGGTGMEDTLQARSDRAVGDVWLPLVYVTTVEAQGTAPWSGSTVIGLGSTAAGGWTLTVHDDHASLDCLGLAVHPQRLTAPSLAMLVDLLTTAAPPKTADAPTERRALEDETADALAALPSPLLAPSVVLPVATGTGQLRINVLGPITIEGLPANIGSHLSRRSTELLVYLALRGRATGPELDEALWHGQRIDNQTRNSLVYRTRQRVGADVLPIVGPDGIYRLGPTVACDWTAFQALAHRGLAAGPDGLDDLQAALDLVRDRPLLGIRDQDYTWAEYDIQHMISTIADVAHVAAQLQSARGAHRVAIEAATKGLLAEPVSEALQADRISAANAADDLAEARRLRARWENMLADLDPEFA